VTASAFTGGWLVLGGFCVAMKQPDGWRTNAIIEMEINKTGKKAKQKHASHSQSTRKQPSQTTQVKLSMTRQQRDKISRTHRRAAQE